MRVAIFDDVAPTNVVTGADLVVDPLDPIGIPASALTAGQQDLLMARDRVVRRHHGRRHCGVAPGRGPWPAESTTSGSRGAGPTERGKVAYYRVQGAEFLIEFDNTQEDPNQHPRGRYRDFDGDLGRDLLREHVARMH